MTSGNLWKRDNIVVKKKFKNISATFSFRNDSRNNEGVVTYVSFNYDQFFFFMHTWNGRIYEMWEYWEDAPCRLAPFLKEEIQNAPLLIVDCN